MSCSGNCPTVCFDVSGFQGLSISQTRDYQMAWNTFQQIQGSNLYVSTMRQAGDTKLVQYNFKNQEQKDLQTNGRMLHIRRYPNSNWDPVPKN